MDLKSIVSPAAKFHLAILIIKGEPSDVHGTGRHKDPWREERFRPSLSYQFLPDLVGCRCRYHRWSPPRWSGRWSRKLHWHWIVDRSRVNIIKTLIPPTRYQASNMRLRNVYLLYIRMSGFQRLLGGTRISLTLLYSETFHLILVSVHSWRGKFSNLF